MPGAEHPGAGRPAGPGGHADGAEAEAPARALNIVFLGQPNVGKTTLFNRLAGVRAKTSNFPGTTQEARIAPAKGAGLPAGSGYTDLPGIYSLELDAPESEVCRGVLDGRLAPAGETVEDPDVLCVVLDATNLAKSMRLLGEALRRRLPTVVAINMVDAARKLGIRGDEDELSRRLGCPVVICSGRTGEGAGALRGAFTRARIPVGVPGPTEDELESWAGELAVAVFAGKVDAEAPSITDRLDRVFTHPLLGVALFVAVMTGLFWTIFRFAEIPMGWVEGLFAGLAGAVEGSMGEGLLSELLAGGVVAGLGATLVFLPQIVLLFFLIALLEETGYLARAAFVMDRVLRPFGLNGHAFVPLLSSHACALPGIMATRAIPDRRDRLAAILVAPFMSCTARIPVYVMLTGILFPGQPGLQALAYTGCYALGIIAGLLSSLVARRTILRGRSRAMALELPVYRLPNIKTAGLHAADRGWIFLKKAGTVILAISIVLWWLGAFPQVGAPEGAEALRAQAAQVEQDQPEAASELVSEAEGIEARAQSAGSYLGSIGSFAQPVFAPLGYDRQLTIGVIASFAAREVFATTMAVTVLGDEEADVEDEGVIARIAVATRDDGSALFDPATSWSLLIYYVLAMQCLPTLVVTARESGGWKWAALQLGWMSGLAYLGAMGVRYAVLALG